MTDSSICCTNMENGIEKHNKEIVPIQKSATTGSGSRPTAIPRLLSGNFQRSNQPADITGRHDTKNPLTPLNIQSNRPKSVGSYIKSPLLESENFTSFLTSPTYSKRSSRDSNNMLQNYLTVDVRLRSNAKSLNRYDRAISEENKDRKTSMESSFSEKISNSGSNTTGNQYVITSKIGSLSNTRHKPGGGNVKIFDKKLDLGNVEAKCGSKRNINHKPGGGVIEIHNEKLDFKQKAQSKINSLKNIEYQPCGGDVKIDNKKLEWNVASKVGSLANIKHKPCGGNIQIAKEPLPWLKYNKPNLPPEEIAKINKKVIKDESKNGNTVSRSCSNSNCSDRSN